MSLSNWIFTANIVLFVICIVIQGRAMIKQAFQRVLFIQIAMFLFAGLVYIAPNAPRLLVWILFLAIWLFTLVMTGYAVSRGGKK